LGRPGHLEHTLEVGIAKLAEDSAKLIEKHRSVFVLLRKRDLTLTK